MYSKFISACIFSLFTFNSAAAQNWNQFRGPQGSGIASVVGALPSAFDQTNNLVWRNPVSPGHSSPCIWEDRIFVSGYTGQAFETHCFDRESGKILWKKSVEVGQLEKTHRVGSPAASTPATDGERVFVYFGSFGLLCYDFEGNEQWRRPLPLPENTFGTAVSPIVAGKYLIFNSDQNKESYLEAIDPSTGKTVWKKDRPGFKSGWSTPMHWQNGGVDELVIYGVWWIAAYDLRDGSERWSLPGLTDEPIITPVAGEGMIFLTSYNMKTNPEVIGLPDFTELLRDYDKDQDGQLTSEEIEANKSILSRNDADGEGDHPLRIFFKYLDEDRDGKITLKEWDKIIAFIDSFKQENALMAIRPGDKDGEVDVAWRFHRGVPECPSPLYYKGRVYMVKNGGIISCLDAQTGALKYQDKLKAGGPYYASLVVGDGKIYASSARGVVTVFEVGDELNILARNDLRERIMATPAIVEGKLYVRTAESLYAFGLPVEPN